MASEVGSYQVADYDCNPPDSETNELKFNIGNIIKVIDTDSDWWYGECINSHDQGWYDPKYCHKISIPLIALDPYENYQLSSTEYKRKQADIIQDIKSSEVNFITTLKTFIDIISKPLLLRDTPFKRSFLNDPSFAVCITLIQDIFVSCSNFLQELNVAKSYSDIARCYNQFAPSIQLFGQFISENAGALHALKQHQKNLNEFLENNRLPDGLTIETCFILPLQHASSYFNSFQTYFKLVDINDSGFYELLICYEQFSKQTEIVEMRLEEEKANLQLLFLQSQFNGNAAIFKQGRRLIKEGTLERVKILNNNAEFKMYYGHLFNDCLMYSVKRSSSYKLHKVIDINTVNVKIAEESEYGTKNVINFTLKSDSSFVASFRCTNSNEVNDWMTSITKLISTENSTKKSPRLASTAQVTSIPGINPENLGPRALCVYSFLQQEIPFVNSLQQIYSVLIKPMINSSKGASLEVGKWDKDNADRNSVDSNKQKKSEIIKLSTIQQQSSTNKIQTQQIVEQLQIGDVQIFLRAAEFLSLNLRELFVSIENQCTKVQWAEQIEIGNIFNTASSNSLYHQFQSYASSLHAVLRILTQNNLFLNFYKECDFVVLSTGMNNMKAGKLRDKLLDISKHVESYLLFLNELYSLTPTSSSDHKLLKSSVDHVSTQLNSINEVIKSKLNFEKLLEIQASFIISNASVSSMFTTTDSFISKIASFDRIFIKEGDLKKVCRKKNKTFHFWLFTDYLIYGSSVGSNTYNFHRSIDLNKCTVQLHSNKDLKYSFEIFGTEKSFIVIAASDKSQNEWMMAINKAIEDLKTSKASSQNTLESSDIDQNVAPLWVPDTVSDKCTICQQGFSFFRRRHHCRACGSLVCGDDSKQKLVLTHIHETNKQRVCDKCFTLGSSPNIKRFSNPISTPSTSDVASKVLEPDETESLTVNDISTTQPPNFENLLINDDTDADDMLFRPSIPMELPPPLPVDFSISTIDIPSTLPPPPPVTTSPPPVPSSRPVSVSIQRQQQDRNIVPSLVPVPIPMNTNIRTAPLKPIKASLQSVNKTTPLESKRVNEEVEDPLPDNLLKPNPLQPQQLKEKVNEPLPDSLPLSIPQPDATANSVNKGITDAASTIMNNETKFPVPVNLPISGPAETSPVSPRTDPVRFAPPPPPKPAKVKEPEGKNMENRSELSQDSIRSPPPPPPIAKSNMNFPPPPPPPPQSQSSDSSGDQEDSLSKYRKMKEMLPEGAVRLKMKMDGFHEDLISDFFAGKKIDLNNYTSGNVAVISTESSTVRGGLDLSAVKLKTSQPVSKEKIKSPKLSVLDEIQSGVKLKSLVNKAADTRMKSVGNTTSGGGLLDKLAIEMFKRRVNLRQDDKDSDSDASGFSDSDSDDD